jgi:hypothetical protein
MWSTLFGFRGCLVNHFRKVACSYTTTQVVGEASGRSGRKPLELLCCFKQSY